MFLQRSQQNNTFWFNLCTAKFILIDQLLCYFHWRIW